MLKFLQVCHLPSTSLAQTCTSAFRDLSTSTSARFARFQERYRFNPNRRPQSSPKVYDTQKVANELVHPDAIPVRPPRNLWIATVFTAGVSDHLRVSNKNFDDKFLKSNLLLKVSNYKICCFRLVHLLTQQLQFGSTKK